MHWEPCEGCGEQTIIFDLTKTPTGYRCDECSKERIAELAADPDIQKAAEQFIKQQQIEQRHPLQVEFGFDKPEDGSERRFAAAQAKNPVVVPWIKYRFWWILHNSFIHPLIGVYPCKTTFLLHDWSSRRMHGQKGKR